MMALRVAHLRRMGLAPALAAALAALIYGEANS